MNEVSLSSLRAQTQQTELTATQETDGAEKVLPAIFILKYLNIYISLVKYNHWKIDKVLSL